MAFISKNTDKSRGGFQNRDVGRSDLLGDFGPAEGTDFARFSDPPDPVADLKLLSLLEERLKLLEDYEDREIIVRNGFVFLKGFVPDQNLRDEISRLVSSISGVIEVQNHIHLKSIQ